MPSIRSCQEECPALLSAVLHCRTTLKLVNIGQLATSRQIISMAACYTQLQADRVPLKHIGKINRAAWSWCDIHFQFYMKNHCIFSSVKLGSSSPEETLGRSYEREHQLVFCLELMERRHSCCHKAPSVVSPCPLNSQKVFSLLSPLLFLHYRTTPWMLLIQFEEWFQMEMWKKKNSKDCLLGYKVPC